MPFTPDPPFPKARGQTLRSKDWNDLVVEVQRLDTDKVTKAGDAMSGPLTIDAALSPTQRHVTVLGGSTAFLTLRAASGPFELLVGADGNGGIVSTMTNHDLHLRAGGNTTRLTVKASGRIGVGTTDPQSQLHVVTDLSIGPFSTETIPGSCNVTGPSGQFTFVRRNLTAWPATPAAGDRFIWYNQTGGAALWTDQVADLLRISSSGALGVRNSSGGFATFMPGAPRGLVVIGGGGAALANNRVELVMDSGASPQYEFSIGHLAPGFGGIGGTFGLPQWVSRLTLDQAGNLKIAGALTASGGKGGYVIDFFVNRVGAPLEQGDVIVIGPQYNMRFYGQDSAIPVPEVDIAEQAYDRRVCGIVDRVVTHELLPLDDVSLSDAQMAAARAGHTELQAEPNSLMALAAAQDTSDKARVEDRQMGKMVTLGAYAFCKVDADIEPIAAGDLLTTSPTRGHAQKVTEPGKAVGAIVGKALASLASGKDKIPVLVMLQ